MAAIREDWLDDEDELEREERSLADELIDDGLDEARDRFVRKCPARRPRWVAGAACWAEC